MKLLRDIEHFFTKILLSILFPPNMNNDNFSLAKIIANENSQLYILLFSLWYKKLQGRNLILLCFIMKTNSSSVLRNHFTMIIMSLEILPYTCSHIPTTTHTHLHKQQCSNPTKARIQNANFQGMEDQCNNLPTFICMCL